VAVGRAIVREPKVFLFDEPLSNLDAKLRVAMRAEISKLHKRLETTFIYVTHDQMEAMTMATRIAVMKNGVILQLDTPQNLYDHPTNVFVAGFIGSPAMNFFNGRLVRSDGALHFEAGPFKLPVPESKAGRYSPHAGKDVILGIRPEDIHNPAFVPAGIHAAPVEGRVDVSELMGNEVFLYMLTGETTFVGRVDPRTQARMGDRMQVMFNMDNMHLFDPEGEQLAIQ
jgi:multiple sugar transport system ATP-binding protein